MINIVFVSINVALVISARRCQHDAVSFLVCLSIHVGKLMFFFLFFFLCNDVLKEGQSSC